MTVQMSMLNLGQYGKDVVYTPDDIAAWGGVREVYTIAAGSTIRFPVGFAVGAVHLQRNYRGGMMTTFRNAGR